MPYIKTCHFCNKEFTTDLKRRKYCNSNCYHKSQRKRVTKLCEQCGKEMILIPKVAKKRRYCSYKCNNKSRAKTPETKPMPCPTCGKIFTPNRTKPETFCSFECYKKSTKRNQPRTCKNCGNDFLPANDSIKFCSRQCMRIYSIIRTHIAKQCNHCGKEFTSRISDNRIYCSVLCKANNMKVFGPDHHSWKGGPNSYGPHWDEQAKKARTRDSYTCQLCGTKQRYPSLDVHHIIPLRDFDGDYDSANQLDNLVTLCRGCHNKVEKNKLVTLPLHQVVAPA